MNKFFLVTCLFCTLACSKGDDMPAGNNNNNNNNNPGGCGTYNGYPLYKDAGGCYYSDGYNGKVYVAAGLCDC